MSKEEYLLVFESILYAAVLTRIVSGLAGLYRDRGTYILNWAHILGLFSSLLYIIQAYFASKDLSHFKYATDSGNFFLFVVLPIALIAFATHIVLPNDNKNQDFSAILIKHRVALFLSFAYALAIVIYENLEKHDFSLDHYTGWVPHVSMIAIGLGFMLTKRFIFLYIYLVMAICTTLFFMFLVN